MEGGQLVEIPLTVLGTLGAVAPESEMVLVRLEAERFKQTGVIAGMSGSPVYVDGRLLGALAVGWPFATEPIAGVTPFSRMQQLASPATAGGGEGRTSSSLELEEIVGAWRDGTLDQLVLSRLFPEPSSRATNSLQQPVTLAAGGLGPPCAWLEEGWQRLGWVSTPGGAGDAPTTDEIVPGSMVAGIMVAGDATVAVGGTVTEVRGDQLWALGHPFLGGGSFAFPLARARVVAVLPSSFSSAKLFEVGEVVGALEVDRAHGVWGRLGDAPPMVDVAVEASGESYSFQCVRHPVLFPILLGYLTHASHGARGRVFGDQTLGVRLEISYRGMPEIVFEETYSGADAPAMAAALVSAVMAYLEGSSFVVPEVDSVRVRIEAVETIERAHVVDVVPDRPRVRAGESLDVRVRLRRHRGDVETRQVRLQVPPEVVPGPLDLVVADGISWAAYDLQMRPSRPASFADEVEFLNRLVPSTHLVMVFERQDVGVTLPGARVAVPPSVFLTLRSGLGSNLGMTSYRVVSKHDEVLPYPVLGAQRVSLIVHQDGSGLAAAEQSEGS